MGTNARLPGCASVCYLRNVRRDTAKAKKLLHDSAGCRRPATQYEQSYFDTTAAAESCAGLGNVFPGRVRSCCASDVSAQAAQTAWGSSGLTEGSVRPGWHLLNLAKRNFRPHSSHHEEATHLIPGAPVLELPPRTAVATLEGTSAKQTLEQVWA